MTRWLKRIALVLLAVGLLVFLAAWWLLRGSLPQLDGELALPGLSAPVTLQRDALGVVTIDAASETDAMRALGYVHAQERYFEMDLMRRSAAGELAELFGPIALETDKQHRVHRLRARVMRGLDAFAGDRLPQLKAYTDGVNAGLAALKVRPWPYLLLRQEPKPWLLADSALTGYAMYFDLQDSQDKRELALWKIRPHVPGTLFALLTRDGTAWDAPLVGRPRGDAVLPTADQLDLRRLPMPDTPNGRLPQKTELGSNNFAVSGVLTRDGRAILADDMHLGLRAPDIWFRARMRYADPHAPGGRVDVSGFTLPGLPAVIVGSNGHVSWGFTNGYADTADWAVVPKCTKPSLDARPLPPLPRCNDGRNVVETIRVAGRPAQKLIVHETFWGPTLYRMPDGSALALRWVAQLRGSLNLALADLARAATLHDASGIADHVALPVQNLLLADREGRVEWRLVGALPDRNAGCDGKLVATHVASIVPSGGKIDGTSGTPGSPCVDWSIVLDRMPYLIDPASQRLWTANNRVVDGESLQRVGDGGYALGARAKQIRDDLFARDTFAERDLLAIQLDDRALFLQRWWQLLRNASTRSRSPALRELADASGTWQGRASVDSVGYRIVRAWRLAVLARIADGLTAPAQAALGDDFAMPNLPQVEGVAWPLVTQRPANLAPRRFAKCAPDTTMQSQCGDRSWQALFEDAAREVRDALEKQGPLARRTWGERNTAHVCHPLAGAIPWFGKRDLCMPADELAGDVNMPRVTAPEFGASERMVVSPGHEADGIIHMPGGQSDHPLSPFWGAGHEDWVHGRPTPFLPGKTRYVLKLKPGQ